MDKARAATVMAGVSLLAAVLALDWSNVLKVLAELPVIVKGYTGALPFGFGSFLLSVGIGGGIWSAVFLHPSVCKYRPHTCADLSAVSAGLLANIVQQWITEPTPRQMAWAILLGLFAGLVAMLASRLVWSWGAPPKEQP